MGSLRNVGQTTAAVLAWQLAFASAVGAAPYPGTGAAISAANRLSPEGDQANPFAYPFLADIARSLAKNGLPPGFFLQADGKSSASSIDLRAILLFEAGILKAPVRLLVPGKKKEDKVPALSMPALPESGPQFPGNDKPAVALPGARPGLDEGARSGPARPRLSLDFDRFQMELIKPQNKNELSDAGKAVVAAGIGFSAPKRSTVHSFRLWTLRQGPPLAPQATKAPLSARDEHYSGSFLVSSPGAIRTIEGRVFQLATGNVLAVSRGQSMVLDGPAARITLAPGSSAVCQIDDSGQLELRVLESDKPVSLSFKKAGKSEGDLYLSAGEHLIWSETALSPAQRKLLPSGVDKSGENWQKGRFSPSAFLDKSALMKSEPLLPSDEFRSALKNLRDRVK